MASHNPNTVADSLVRDADAAEVNQHIQEIPVADDASFTDDSAYGDEFEDDTESIASTIFRHREIYGRLFAKFREGEYWGPNDEIQNDQLDIFHHMIHMLLGERSYRNPLTDPRSVLDVGTGTGIWAIDMADQYPQAQVLGVDISPTQPNFVPPNCRFELDDVCTEWYYPNGQMFDFIHVRALYGCVRDWPALYQQVIKHLHPGGYIEQLEMSIQFKSDKEPLPADNVLSRWSKLFIDIGENEWGKTFQIAEKSTQYIVDAGFEDVNVIRYKLPIGDWSSDERLKELGKWNLLHCYQGAEGWALFMLTQIMGWKREEVQILVAELRNALRDRRLQAYFEVVSVYGKKPGVLPAQR